ncbi:MAG: hypothetical protein ABIA67_00165 [Candidatus Margulisiibacteriota bacterium]
MKINRSKNLAVRKQIASFIEGSRKNLPSSLTTRGGYVHLCQLTNGEDIYLGTSLHRNSRVIVEITSEGEQLLAEVFAQSKPKKSETFLVIDGLCIYYIGKNLTAPASDTSKPQAMWKTEDPLKRKEENEIKAWLLGGRDEAPDPIKRRIGPNGNIPICNLGDRLVKIKIDPLAEGFEADIFFFNKKDGTRIAVVEVEDFEIDEEFPLTVK